MFDSLYTPAGTNGSYGFPMNADGTIAPNANRAVPGGTGEPGGAVLYNRATPAGIPPRGWLAIAIIAYILFVG